MIDLYTKTIKKTRMWTKIGDNNYKKIIAYTG